MKTEKKYFVKGSASGANGNPYEKQILLCLWGISLFAVGTFHPYLSGFLTAALCLQMVWMMKSRTALLWRNNLTTAAVMAAVLGHLFCVLWAADSGMALIGFFKFFPVAVFLLILLQNHELKEHLLRAFPAIMAVMTILSVAGALLPAARDWFTVAGRLAGFQQYPNTFALLLLTAELILLSQRRLDAAKWGILIVLVSGILFTGSRTAFALLILSNLAMGVLVVRPEHRMAAAAAIILTGACVLATAKITHLPFLERFLHFSLKESTLAGRLLYARDGLLLALRYPFGMGYGGYFYVQPSIQTGVYSVMFAHNDFLQIMLDVGWIPFGLAAVAVIRTILNSAVSGERKIILTAFSLHCCLDFDLQFVSAALLFVMLLDFDKGKEKKFKVRRWWKYTCVGMTVLSLYMAIALFLPRMGLWQAGQRLYPWNTENNTAVLLQTEDLSEANRIANQILKQNRRVLAAQSVKAKTAFSKGNFGELISIENEVIKNAPYCYREYEEYAYMLMYGIELYEKAGDHESAEICAENLIALRNQLRSMPDRLSHFGKQIKDQPRMQLPADLEAYIQKLSDNH